MSPTPRWRGSRFGRTRGASAALGRGGLSPPRSARRSCSRRHELRARSEARAKPLDRAVWSFLSRERAPRGILPLGLPAACARVEAGVVMGGRARRWRCRRSGVRAGQRLLQRGQTGESEAFLAEEAQAVLGGTPCDARTLGVSVVMAKRRRTLMRALSLLRSRALYGELACCGY